MSFADLKKNNKSIFQKLSSELEKTSGSSNGDDRLWKPQLDKSGNGYAVIRFLPAPDGESLPWAKLYSHSFQGPGGWYIENSLTTLGQQDPLSQYNSELWNSGSDANKEIARKQKRKLSYYSNIYVVKDPANPANEGKVFLFRYGKKIFDKITEAMEPQFEDEQPVNPFDMWEGADFKLKICKVAGYWNYDKSEFARPTPLLGGDDDELEALWKTEYSLEELVAPDKFKTFEQLEARMKLVLGQGRSKQIDEEVTDEEEYAAPAEPSYTPKFSKRESQASADFNAPDITPSSSFQDDEDSDLSYFARLADA